MKKKDTSEVIQIRIQPWERKLLDMTDMGPSLFFHIHTRAYMHYLVDHVNLDEVYMGAMKALVRSFEVHNKRDPRGRKHA